MKLIDELCVLRNFALISGFLIVAGCATHQDGRDMFERERDFDVGRYVKVVPLPEPNEKLGMGDGTKKYIYGFKDGSCKWYYIVGNEDEKIKSWGYVGDSAGCVLRMSWGAPW